MGRRQLQLVMQSYEKDFSKKDAGGIQDWYQITMDLLCHDITLP